ncbi:MAG: alpha/beta hydrolase [Verrucomicrobia bacterium]|nr:alpha/beta hydrolase [Verrucomicrobiota bacterium]
MTAQSISLSPHREVIYQPLHQLPVIQAEQSDEDHVAISGPEEVTSSLAGKLVYVISRPIAIACFYPLTIPSLLHLKGHASSIVSCRELLVDFGGESVQIRSTEGAVLDGMFFDPAIFQERQQAAFEKWRSLFAHADFLRLAAFLEVERRGDTLGALMGLPPEVQPIGESEIKGVVCTLGAGCIYEFNPQSALMHLLRGRFVLMFNYRGIMNSQGTPDGRATCIDGLYATEWFKQRLHCENHEVCVLGTSMGSGAAVYTAAQLPGTDLIIDRGFCRMDEVVQTRIPCILSPIKSLTSFAIENFYRYPNEELLPSVQGRVLIIEAVNDQLIPSSHPERLFSILVRSKIPHAEREEIDTFKDQHWIKAPGSHSSIAGGDEEYSWYRDGNTHARLSRFLTKRTESYFV